MLCHFWCANLMSPMTKEDIAKVSFLTGGNGHDLLRSVPMLA